MIIEKSKMLGVFTIFIFTLSLLLSSNLTAQDFSVLVDRDGNPLPYQPGQITKLSISGSCYKFDNSVGAYTEINDDITKAVCCTMAPDGLSGDFWVDDNGDEFGCL